MSVYLWLAPWHPVVTKWQKCGIVLYRLNIWRDDSDETPRLPYATSAGRGDP